MEWLWSAHEGSDTPSQIFDAIYADAGRRDPFWRLPIGNPGPGRLFSYEVYYRGAMTLQALRATVGDDAFFTILRQWTARRAGKNVTTPQFVRLSERVSGMQLDGLFDAWLFSGRKPPDPRARASATPRAHQQTTSFLADLKRRPLH
jgi:aminopeptidase N